MLALAMALVLSNHPNLMCNGVPCSAYDTCKQVGDTSPVIMVREACDLIKDCGRYPAICSEQVPEIPGDLCCLD